VARLTSKSKPKFGLEAMKEEGRKEKGKEIENGGQIDIGVQARPRLMIRLQWITFLFSGCLAMGSC
jgi:hypothetical protein